MPITVMLSVAVCVVGAALYALAQGKPAELGRLSFVVGLLAFLLTFAGKTLHLSG